MKSKLILSMLVVSNVPFMGYFLEKSYAADEEKSLQSTARSVSVLTVVPQYQVLTVELPARTNAFMEAEVRPQVSGIIAKRNFVEGGFVTQGQSLYQIDEGLFQANLLSMQADLERAQALEEASFATFERYRNLLKTNSISPQELDSAKANYKDAKAQVLIAKAGIKTAQINLDFTQVKAPISGIIGQSNVTAGALVTANQANYLAIIQQLDPIRVDLVQSATQLLRLKSALSQGTLESVHSAPLTLTLSDGSVYPYQGALKFTEVSVNQNTGSVLLGAEFANPDHTLLPGMFVRATLTLGADPDAILLPQNLVTRDATGQAIVMTVVDGKVTPKHVTTAEEINNHWRITHGLQAGDKVISTGLQFIHPGMRVTIASDKPSNATTNELEQIVEKSIVIKETINNTAIEPMVIEENSESVLNTESISGSNQQNIVDEIQAKVDTDKDAISSRIPVTGDTAKSQQLKKRLNNLNSNLLDSVEK